MNASGSSHSIARALAEVFTSGLWTVDDIVDRGGKILGRRGRWLRPLARRLVAAFDNGCRPRAARVAEFLVRDAGFRRAMETHSPSLRYDHWPKPLMNAAAGPPSTWDVPQLATTAELAAFLGLEPSRIDWFADPAGLLAKVCDQPLRHYRYEWRLKRSGEPRLIEAPKPALKRIQRRVLTGILDRIPPHDAAHGFRAGRSILTFARPHVAQAVVLKLDLRDFFASITAGRVQSIFRTAGYPEEIARFLTGLCTSRAPRDVLRGARSSGICRDFPRSAEIESLYGKRHLAQGSPTSPSLANLCAFRLDARLSGLARADGGIYTRYADDLVFSGDESFARHIERFATHVAAVVLEEGFAVNHRKTRILRPGVRQQVAGVVVNAHPNPRRADYDRLKSILHNCVRHGPASQNRESHEDFRAHLAGRVAHVSMLNPARGRKLKEVFDRVIW